MSIAIFKFLTLSRRLGSKGWHKLLNLHCWWERNFFFENALWMGYTYLSRFQIWFLCKCSAWYQLVIVIRICQQNNGIFKKLYRQWWKKGISGLKSLTQNYLVMLSCLMLDTSDIYIICYPEYQRKEPTTVFITAILL